jgi:hypothetical protein
MPSLSIEITEQRVDGRSNEVAMTVKALNSGSAPLSITSLTPRGAEGSTIIEQRDASRELTKEKQSRLCIELKELLRMFMICTNNDLRKKVINAQVELIRDIISAVPSAILRVYLSTFMPSLRKNIRRRFERERAYVFDIDKLSDAEFAVEKWLKAAPDADSIKTLFEAKLMQLKELKDAPSTDSVQSSIATLQPDEAFTRDYVVRFKRGFLTQRSFAPSVDCDYVIGADKRPDRSSRTITITVTPYPLALSLVAVVSGLLGAILQYTLSVRPSNAPLGFVESLSAAVFTAKGVTAMILSLLFFNIYEQTDLGRRLRIGVDWRAALLIGVLSGIGGDRIIAALKALIGAT